MFRLLPTVASIALNLTPLGGESSALSQRMGKAEEFTSKTTEMFTLNSYDSDAPSFLESIASNSLSNNQILVQTQIGKSTKRLTPGQRKAGVKLTFLSMGIAILGIIVSHRETNETQAHIEIDRRSIENDFNSDSYLGHED